MECWPALTDEIEGESTKRQIELMVFIAPQVMCIPEAAGVFDGSRTSTVTGPALRVINFCRLRGLCNAAEYGCCCNCCCCDCCGALHAQQHPEIVGTFCRADDSVS